MSQQLMKIIGLSALLLVATVSFRPGRALAAGAPHSANFLVAKGTSNFALEGVLAMTCQEKTWQQFVNWSRRKGWSEHRLSQSLEVLRDDQSVQIESEHIRLSFTATGQIHLQSPHADITAIDGCDLLNQFEKASATNKNGASAMSRLISLDAARADDLVRESQLTEDVTIGASLAVGTSLLLTFWPPTSLLGIAFLATTLADVAVGVTLSYRDIATKNELVTALNSEFKLQCNGAGMVLTYASGTIVVRKVNGVAQIEFTRRAILRNWL